MRLVVLATALVLASVAPAWASAPAPCKLVTSAALILMFAFLVLSSSPGFEIKEFAIGLAAGIIFDATVIRALLVPSLMRLLGPANWWMPDWTRAALFIPREKRMPEPTSENA